MRIYFEWIGLWDLMEGFSIVEELIVSYLEVQITEHELDLHSVKRLDKVMGNRNKDDCNRYIFS
jgi:hypothetical protein